MYLLMYIYFVYKKNMKGLWATYSYLYRFGFALHLDKNFKGESLVVKVHSHYDFFFAK